MTTPPTHRRALPGLLLAFAALLTVACSGGGSESPTAPGASLSEIEFRSFQLANTERGATGLEPPLAFDEQVALVARGHSESMRDNNFFAHDGPNGGLLTRLKAGSVTFTAAGENLAKVSGTSDPAGQAHAQFLNSTAHRAVMLDKRFELAGVGVAANGDTYWLTQIYVRR